MCDDRFLNDAEEFFVRCCKNGLFAMNIELCLGFIWESLMPGARERLLRSGRVASLPAERQFPALMAAIKENPGVLLAVTTRHDISKLDTDYFLSIVILCYRASA